MAKNLVYNEEARKKIFAGLEKVANAVKVTLGPAGRNVIIEKEYGSPVITKDGVTVAKEICLEDKIENLGAQLLKEVTSKTNDIAGDNTTTSAVLAYAIVKEGLKSVASGMRPIEIKRGIDYATDSIINSLKSISTFVSTTGNHEFQKCHFYRQFIKPFFKCIFRKNHLFKDYILRKAVCLDEEQFL